MTLNDFLATNPVKAVLFGSFMVALVAGMAGLAVGYGLAVLASYIP